MSGPQKWADFTAWVQEKTRDNAKVRPSRQIPLLPAPGLDAHGRTVSHGRTGAPETVAPLVNRCISQHAKKNSVLGVKFEVYPKSVRVVRPVALPPGATRGGLRSSIDGFSEGSRRRLKRTASEASDILKSQFGLTYHETRPSGDDVKRHLNAWLTWLRRRVKGIKYLWVLEFQRRGVPHFHVFLSVECVYDALHVDMANKWNEITGETPEHRIFHMNAKNFIPWDMGSGAYACKYLEKEYQKHVPDGFGWVGRFWGSSRSLVPPPCVYDVHEMRALCGQNVEKACMNVPRETHGRDAGAAILRALGEFQRAQWRRYGRKGKTLSQSRNSRWVQGGASVLWRVVEHLHSQAP